MKRMCSGAPCRFHWDTIVRFYAFSAQGKLQGPSPTPSAMVVYAEQFYFLGLESYLST